MPHSDDVAAVSSQTTTSFQEGENPFVFNFFFKAILKGQFVCLLLIDLFINFFSYRRLKE